MVKRCGLAIGVGVSFALVLGLATVALAAVPGDPFRLGKVNVINNATTTLQGSGLSGPVSSSVLQVKRDGATGGPALTVDNASSSSAARGIDINVPFGETPINVNSSAGKSDLNVDSLDGFTSSEFLQESTDRDDFLPRRTYVKSGAVVTLGANETGFAAANCDTGDVALSGGYTVGFGASTTVFSVSTSGGGSSIGFTGPRAVIPNVTCADFPPLG